VTITSEDPGYRQHDGGRNAPFPEFCTERRPHVLMLGALGQGHSEGVGAGDPRDDASASVRLVAWRETVDAGRALGRVELGGVVQVTDTALVHLLGDPAFVPDVRMAAALVERGEHALHFGRAVAGDRQPGPLSLVLVEVFRGVSHSDLRQASAPRLEPEKGVPFRRLPLEVSGVLGTAARL